MVNERFFQAVAYQLAPLFRRKAAGLAPGGKQAEGYMRLNIGCARGILQKGLDQMAKMYADYINK